MVGLAFAVAVEAVGSNTRKNHADTLMNDCVYVASQAAAWRSKETPYIGGGGSYVALETDGMNKLLLDEDRLPGTLRITGATANTLEITAVSDIYPEIGVRVRVTGTEITETVIAFDGSITLP